MSGQLEPIEDLIKISGLPLSTADAHLPPFLLDQAGVRGGELLKLLRRKNGFFAFESALHVMPTVGSDTAIDVARWNSESLWRSEYGDLARDYLFFSEDLFGNQFGIKGGIVYRFDAETAESEPIADDIRGWARRILREYPTLTGYPLGHAWQSIHGPLEPLRRLSPKTPFVVGGEYSVTNLYDSDAVEGMRFRGFLARRLHALPDGAKIEFKITP